MHIARLLLLVLFFLTVETAACLSLAAETGDLQSHVRALTRQLAADRLADREQAQRELLDLGPAVLDLLPDTSVRLPAEANRRLTDIRQQLEVKKSQESAEGRRITLKAIGQPLSTLIAELETRSGNRVVDYRPLRRQPQTEIPVSVDLKNVTFWEALDRILGKAQMEIYPYAIDAEGQPLRGIAFVARDLRHRSGAGPVDYQAGFRFEVTQISGERDYRNADADELSVHVETLWEPRLDPVQLILLRNTVTAVDERGRKLVRKGNGETEIPVNRTAPIFILPFELPGNDSQTIQTLSGELRCLLPSERTIFRFENLSAATPQRLQKAYAVVTLQSVHAQGEEWVLQIGVRLKDAEKALESHLTGWIRGNAVYLEDANGVQIEPFEVEQTAEHENAFGFAFRFKPEKKIEDYSLIYSLPTTFVTRRIPFRFEGLKLP